MPNCFEPVIDSQSKILILGTLPGTLSLAIGQYYANPQNQIWEILFSIYDIQPDNSYTSKCTYLLANKIALWDVLKFANREGSLDANITDPIPNDFKNLFAHYPNIKYVIFNGTKAEAHFRKNFKEIYESMCCKYAPSTSPTPGRNVKTLNEKKSSWKEIISSFTALNNKKSSVV